MSRFSHLTAALAFCICCGLAPAQMQWGAIGQWPPSTSTVATMDRDRDRLVAVRMSGLTGVTVSEFDGQSGAVPTTSPLAQISPMMLCYDEARRESVVLGSHGLTGVVGTWTWKGQKWTLVSTQIPTVLNIMASTFHRGRQKVMAIAGIAGSTLPIDLWEWDGSTWSVVSVGQSLPTGVNFQALAYDEARDRLVTCCAQSQNSSGAVFLPYTWEWDAQSGWQIVDRSSPALSSPMLVYDEARKTLVLWAYLVTSPSSSSEGWERMGKGSWVRKPNPPERVLFSIYDPIRQRILSLSWTVAFRFYQPVYPAGLTTFSPGCPGFSGTPTITQKATHTGAWIGDTLQVTVDPVPTAFAGLFLGFSNTTYQGIPLPIDLGPIGMPNCSLHVAPEAFLLCTGTGTSCNASLAVPDSNALRGAAFYLQAVVPAPTVNPGGLVMSDAVVVTVGSR